MTMKMYGGDFDNNNIEKLEKNLKAQMVKNKANKMVEA